MSNLPQLSQILAGPQPTNVAEVIARMAAIDAALPSTDGIACFNHLYRTVTGNIQDALDGATFGAPAFVARLDVIFANLYFTALAEYDDGGETRRAWSPLFEARAAPDIAPIQFALAGMNAHINRDLPVALVAVFEALGAPPTGQSAEHDDYERVNDVLALVERTLAETYFAGLGAGRAFAHAEDAVTMWSVRRARDAAWTSSEVLWQLRGHAYLEAEYVEMLDRGFELAGRGLLLA
jgi:hypothetical protein